MSHDAPANKVSDVYSDSMVRNAREAERLNEQYHLLNQNIGYLLHPSITCRPEQAPEIADMGTGTGIFLSELSNSYPKATLHGFDISGDLFPPVENLPSNVTLSLMDIKETPPLEACNRYDIIHVRLISAAMNPEDWEPVVYNLQKLLKPGGALQWEECNFAQGRHYRGKAGCTISAAKSVGDAMRYGLKEKFAYGWSTLPEIMRSAGLIDVEEDIVSSDRVVETRESLSTNGMVAVFQWAKNVSARGMLGSIPAHDLTGFEEQAFKDIKSGCYVRFDIHIILGFKSK